MTAEIVNLRQYRKQKARKTKDRDSEIKRAKHGRGKTTMTTETHERNQVTHDLDGKQLQNDDGTSET